MSLYWIKEMDKLLYSVNFHTSWRTTLFSATGITTSLSMLAFVSLTIKGRETIQHMHIQYGRGVVLPRGQKHKPRLFPSYKWCEITPAVNKYGRDWRKQLFCASHNCNIGTTMKTTDIPTVEIFEPKKGVNECPNTLLREVLWHLLFARKTT